jgi:hypothetical protein
MLADDGIIDPIAAEIAARGARPARLTRAGRKPAAARILARGGTAYVIPKAPARQRNHRPHARRPMPRRGGMTTGIRCRADSRCTVPAPSETGICHCHAKQAKKAGVTIRKLSLAEQVRRAQSRAPEKELEP